MQCNCRAGGNGDSMAELMTEICAFPGCERPVVPGPEGAGRPARYCELPGHTAQTAFRERRRRAAAGEGDDGDAERDGGDRPVSLAAMSLRALASKLSGDLQRTSADLERTREVIGVLTDTEQLEAELAAVRADTQAEVSHVAQQQAAARRERMEADEAAEAALRAAQQAEQHAQAAAREAQTRAEEAERSAQDAIVRAEAGRRPHRRRPRPRPATPATR